MHLSNGWKLATSILLCQSVGIGSGLLGSASDNSWFENLQKPAWNPPNWVFAPVWTTLYLMMGVALWLVWKSDAPARTKRPALTLFGVQLALNFIWSILFFRLQSPMMALADIVALWIAIILTALSFAKISKPAAWMFLPYLCWVSFATFLNYEIFRLNR